MFGNKVGTVNQITKADATTPIPVGNTVTEYSQSFPLAPGENFGIKLLADSDGTVDVLVELEVSMDLPSTEGSADDNFVEPEGFADILNLTDEDVHIKSISAPYAKYGRLKLTGQGSNHSSTTVAADIFKVEVA